MVKAENNLTQYYTDYIVEAAPRITRDDYEIAVLCSDGKEYQEKTVLKYNIVNNTHLLD